MAQFIPGSTDANANNWTYGWHDEPQPPAIGATVLLGSLTLSVLSLGLPIVILQVYDRILPNAAVETFFWLILGLCAILLLDGFLRTARAYVVGWSGAQFEYRFASRAVDRLLGSDIGSFERSAPGVYLDRMQAIDVLRDYYAGQGRLLFADLIFVPMFLGLIWFIGGNLVLLPMALLGLLGYASFEMGLALKKDLESRSEVDHRRFNFIIEVLSGIHTVKLMAMEALLQRRYEKLQESGASRTYLATFHSNVAQSLGTLFSNLTMVSVAFLGAVHVMYGELTIGGLAACILLAGRAVQPLPGALGLWTQFQSIDVARERVKQLFASPPEADKASIELPRLVGAIELKRVTFGYSKNEPPIFRDLELKVAPGEVVGITGNNGCGKSSLLLLTMGVVRPISGQVLLDGIDVRRCDPYHLRPQIGYLPQDAVLFQGTLLDNLTMFRGSERVEDALAASRWLGLDSVISRLPAGYETRVGEGADNDLPAGIKQGVAMARVIAGKPRIILFDEANTAFDRKTDRLMKEILGKLKRRVTMVLVSHRPSILALADQTYDLGNGRLTLCSAQPQAREGRSEGFSQPESGTAFAGQSKATSQLSRRPGA